MNKYSQVDSLNRRIKFSGDFRYKIYNLFHNITEKPTFYRPIELLAQIEFDTVESIRNKSIVPYFGYPNICACKMLSEIEQHPKYRTFYHDEKTNSTVGMFLGVDLIKNNYGYHAVDFNLNAGLTRERRKLFNSDIDPFLINLKKICLENGYEKVVCFAQHWSSDYINEFKMLTNESRVKFVPASPSKHESEYVKKMPIIPQQTEQNTLYVVFHYQHTPIDYFITNQSCTSHWINQGIKSSRFDNCMFKPVDSFDHVNEIRLEDNGEFPNLVIKLGGGWGSQYVKVARIKVDQLDAFCKTFSEQKLLSTFNRSLFTRFRGWIGQHHKILFQKYVLPEINCDRHAQIIRTHLFIAPVNSRMLYCNKIVSNHKVPMNVPYGIINDDKPFIVNWYKGTYYKKIQGDEFSSVENASKQLCQIIYHVLSNKFVVFENK